MEQVDFNELPMGFGMALAKNTEALTAFASMPADRRRAVVEGTHAIQSKREMQEYVNRLSAQG